MFRILVAAVLIFLNTVFSQAQTASASPDLQNILQANKAGIERASRKTLDPILETLIQSKLDGVQTLLESWRQKKLWLNENDGKFYYVKSERDNPLQLVDISTEEIVGTADKSGVKQLKPNSGVRSVIAATLVRFQLIDADPVKRQRALNAISRDPDASHLEILRVTVGEEKDPQIKSQMQRLESLLTIQFDKVPAKRVGAIESFSGDTDVDFRAVLNPILQVKRSVAKELPTDGNLARRLTVGSDLTEREAYDMLVEAKLATQTIPSTDRNRFLIENIIDGKIAGLDVTSLNSEIARDAAYERLEASGSVPSLVTPAEIRTAVSEHVFYESYIEPSLQVTDAARKSLRSIENSVGLFSMIDLGLDGLSLASIYFLAAIGLAITFGVMGVINMAHGEFIMIGAYTGYVVQQIIPDYTVSIIVALPLAFVIAFLAGVALERLVIRHLMHRPLETLLATFGISIALQQLAKNIFGTQARPLTSPAWLDGAWVINDIVSISYIRIAIFFLALMFLLLLLFILNKTRLGLEVRAVTQNPRMASSMGINPDKINMLTFGLGSGIAGIAGVAIGLFAQVTSELGSAYIVQSFMTVVVGGVGNIWGTLAGAGMIGGLQKVIEFFNPSNTLAAQTYMIIFIIIFIQFRPKGIIALKGRAAGD
jgi:urea transport system permease protein